MGNHFHLVVKMTPENRYTDEQIQKRFEAYYGNSREFAAGQIPYWREKLSSLSEFLREIKVGFARYYNRRHRCRGYFWGDRFKKYGIRVDQWLMADMSPSFLMQTAHGTLRRLSFRLRFGELRASLEELGASLSELRPHKSPR